MPNHWHLVLRPQRGRDLAAYLSWLSNTHVKRHHSRYRNTSGHLYQGRYKSFAVAEDRYFLTLLRHVESNPLRAKLVRRAQAWRWSSLGAEDQLLSRLLDKWPVSRPRNWSSLVNQALDQASVERLQVSFVRGRPLGSDGWTQATARRMGLQYTLNPRGRPPKTKKS
jgi:putative transposase